MAEEGNQKDGSGLTNNTIAVIDEALLGVLSVKKWPQQGRGDCYCRHSKKETTKKVVTPLLRGGAKEKRIIYLQSWISGLAPGRCCVREGLLPPQARRHSLSLSNTSYSLRYSSSSTNRRMVNYRE
jgi:hypothetical protein